MSPALERAFDGLRSEGELSPAALRGLSDLDSASAEELRRRWPSLPSPRRLEAVTLAGRLADEHIELNFDRLNLIGWRIRPARARRQAVANLWESEDPSLAHRFLALLQQDPDLAVQAEAARALGRFVLQLEEAEADAGDRFALEEALLAAAAQDDDRLRFPAVESLGFSSRPEVSLLVQGLYDSGTDEAKRSALVAMGRSGDRRWRSIIEAELRSPSPGTRREAARAAASRTPGRRWRADRAARGRQP
jgi:HEAT repeat protein